MDTQCPYCQKDTAGQHEHDCPLHPDNQLPSYQLLIGQAGWICPQCGSVYGPNVAECWRCNGPTPVITWVSNETSPFITYTTGGWLP